MTEPRFIEVGDADDTLLPLPIFVSRKDRSHDEVMRKILRADPNYAADMRTVLKDEGATAELAILERLLDH